MIGRIDVQKMLSVPANLVDTERMGKINTLFRTASTLYVATFNQYIQLMRHGIDCLHLLPSSFHSLDAIAVKPRRNSVSKTRTIDHYRIASCGKRIVPRPHCGRRTKIVNEAHKPTRRDFHSRGKMGAVKVRQNRHHIIVMLVAGKLLAKHRPTALTAIVEYRRKVG